MPEKIKKIKIDEEKCIGCGACNMYAPEAFGFDEVRGKSIVKPGAEDTDQEKIEEAANTCPVQAIELER
jgi:ferredoxin